jgi:hypothetical protein
MSRGFLDDERRSRDVPARSDLVEISAELRHETDRAWLIFDGSREVWIPKSQAQRDGPATFTMSERLATEKGLI